MRMNGPRIDPVVGRPPPAGHWVVISFGVLATTVLYTVAVAVQRSYGAAFFSIPIIVGAVVGLLSLRRPFLNGLITLGLSLGVAVVTLQEGVVCLLYSLPLLVPELMIGVACGWVARRQFRALRHDLLSVLLVLGGLGWQVVAGRLDDPARHPVHAAASSLEIAAPPAQVFAALTERPIEVPSRWPWFLRVGLPMPRRMEVIDPGPRARLVLDFSQGRVHGRVTRWEPGRGLAFAVDRYQIEDLPFHITRLGRGPHWGLRTERVDDWLTLLEVRYALEPAAGGGTIVTRQTTWRRHLAPGFYFGWLQQQIMARGQARLLHLLRERILALPSSGGAQVSMGPHRTHR